MADAQHPEIQPVVVDSTAMASNFGYWLEKALTVPVFVRRYGRIIAVLTAYTLEPGETLRPGTAPPISPQTS